METNHLSESEDFIQLKSRDLLLLSCICLNLAQKNIDIKYIPTDAMFAYAVTKAEPYPDLKDSTNSFDEF